MRITATIQAKIEDDSRRPAKERVAQLAEILQRQGFEVLRAGRFGVSVEADVAAFVSTFGIDPRQVQWQKIPAGKDLDGLAEAVETAVAPTPFVKSAG